MTSTVPARVRPRAHGLVVRQVDAETVIFDRLTNEVHRLDGVANDVWTQATAGTPLDRVARAVGAPAETVDGILVGFLNRGWVEPVGFDRRTFLRRAGAGGAAVAALTAFDSIIAPAPFAAATGGTAGQTYDCYTELATYASNTANNTVSSSSGNYSYMKRTSSGNGSSSAVAASTFTAMTTFHKPGAGSLAADFDSTAVTAAAPLVGVTALSSGFVQFQPTGTVTGGTTTSVTSVAVFTCPATTAASGGVISAKFLYVNPPSPSNVGPYATVYYQANGGTSATPIAGPTQIDKTYTGTNYYTPTIANRTLNAGDKLYFEVDYGNSSSAPQVNAVISVKD